MAEEIMFKVGVDTGNTTKDVQDINKTIDATAKATKDLNKETQQLNKTTEKAAKSTDKWEDQLEALNKQIKEEPINIRKMNKQIQEYQAIALSAGRESAVGKEALKRAAELKDRYIDIQNETTRLANDHKNLKGVMEIGQGVVAGYAAVKGAMALTGMESEALEKTFVKLQAAQALLQGLQQIQVLLEKESSAMLLLKTVRTKALTVSQNLNNKAQARGIVLQTAANLVTKAAAVGMRILNAVMKANPIFLIIAGLAALAGALAFFASETEVAEDQNNRLNESFKRQQEQMERNSQQFERLRKHRTAMLKAAGADQEELHKNTLSNLEQEQFERQLNLTQIRVHINAKTEAYKQALKEENDELARKIKGEIQAEKKKWRDIRQALDNHHLDVTETNAQFEAQQAQQRQKDADKANAAWKKQQEKRKKAEEAEAQKKMELEKLLVDLSVKNIEDETTRTIAALGVKHQRERESLKKKFGENTELEKALKIAQDNEIQKLTNDLEDKNLQKTRDKNKAERERQNADDKAGLEAKLLQIQGDFEAEQELKLMLAEMERDQLLENAELTANERLLIEEQFNAKKKALDEERADSEKNANDAIISSRQQLLGAVATVLGQLSGLAREGSATAKALALTEIGINTAIGFAQGLVIAQKSAAAAGPGAAFAFPIFYATQIGAVLSAASKAKSILGSGSSVSAPSATGGVPESASTPSAFSPGLPDNNETDPESLIGGNDVAPLVVLPVDSVTKVQKDSAKVEALSTVE